ncbi:MAG: hypothetical protein ABIN74_13205 [Ferruginibacter sp.]
MKKTVIIIMLSFFGKESFSQKEVSYSGTEKGRFFVSWGWNRSAYTKSNISFKGSDYDFQLRKVVAHDKPSKFTFHNYLQIDRITIPQTNFRIGYFVRKNLSLSVGFDHMKYVMATDQTVFMKGVIKRQGSFEGNYNGEKQITADLLTYEHSDGLNYINVEADKYVNLYHSANNKFFVDAFLGGGAGILMPRTDIKLLSYERSDQFHVSGFGLNIKAGIQATAFKHLLIKFENKSGYINMPDIILHKKGIPGQAKQTFFFTALDGMIGYSFALTKTKK